MVSFVEEGIYIIAEGLLLTHGIISNTRVCGRIVDAVTTIKPPSPNKNPASSQPQTGVTNIGVVLARLVLLNTCDSGVPSPLAPRSSPPFELFSSGIRTGAHRRGGLDLIALGAGGGTSAHPAVLIAGVSSSPRRRLLR